MFDYLRCAEYDAIILDVMIPGVDDYLVKPFALDGLLARIRVMLRKPASVKTTVYTV